jgi:PAS domain S-box-containing protein
MIILDMRTVIFLSVITYIICTLLIIQLWRQNRRRFAGMAYWVFDFIFQTTALTLIILRGTIPDSISIVLANSLVFAGALLIYMGLERFVEKSSAQIHNYLLFVLYVGAFVYSTFIHPDLYMRTITTSMGLLLISFQCLWLLWRRVEPDKRPMTFWVGMVFGGYCLVSIVRIVEYFVGVHAGGDYFQSGLFQTLVLVFYQLLLILLTYSLILMVNKRLYMAIKTQEEKFAKAFHSAPYAITLTRLSDGTLVDVNEGFVAISGYDRTEVVGKKAMDFHIWEHEEDRTAVIEALSRNVKVYGKEQHFLRKNGETITGLFSAEIILIDGEKNVLSSIADITERKRAEEALEEERRRLQQALDEVRTLRGIVPICANCKKIRDDEGYWYQVEKYVSDHTEARFSHGICPTCFEKEMKKMETHSTFRA